MAVQHPTKTRNNHNHFIIRATVMLKIPLQNSIKQQLPNPSLIIILKSNFIKETHLLKEVQNLDETLKKLHFPKMII
jgi:hypothetical protein